MQASRGIVPTPFSSSQEPFTTTAANHAEFEARQRAAKTLETYTVQETGNV